MKHIKLISLCEGAIFVALAMVLGLIKLFELPQGGSISLGMLPIFIYSYKWGVKKGLLIASVYGLLQLVLDGAYAWGPWSMFLDYILAYTVLGFSGLYCNKKNGLYIGAVVASILRFLVHFVSGITIYKIYAPTKLFNYTWSNPYIYSFVYNISYILLSLIACLIVMFVLNKFIYTYKNKY